MRSGILGIFLVKRFLEKLIKFIKINFAWGHHCLGGLIGPRVNFPERD